MINIILPLLIINIQELGAANCYWLNGYNWILLNQMNNIIVGSGQISSLDIIVFYFHVERYGEESNKLYKVSQSESIGTYFQTCILEGYDGRVGVPISEVSAHRQLPENIYPNFPINFGSIRPPTHFVIRDVIYMQTNGNEICWEHALIYSHNLVRIYYLSSSYFRYVSLTISFWLNQAEDLWYLFSLNKLCFHVLRSFPSRVVYSYLMWIIVWFLLGYSITTSTFTVLLLLVRSSISGRCVGSAKFQLNRKFNRNIQNSKIPIGIWVLIRFFVILTNDTGINQINILNKLNNEMIESQRIDRSLLFVQRSTWLNPTHQLLSPRIWDLLQNQTRHV